MGWSCCYQRCSWPCRCLYSLWSHPLCQCWRVHQLPGSPGSLLGVLSFLPKITKVPGIALLGTIYNCYCCLFYAVSSLKIKLTTVKKKIRQKKKKKKKKKKS